MPSLLINQNRDPNTYPAFVTPPAGPYLRAKVCIQQTWIID